MKSKNHFVKMLFAVLILAVGFTSMAWADPPQGRSRGKEKRFERFDRDDCFGCRDDRGRGRGQDKKADKFINGHDARDGRFDGRGPKVRTRRLPPPRRLPR
ncbi:MAG: hypothetical protein JNK38_13970 [Acidobacteria bacterium]|nr:hypothetical protein [Acidobacteriota bacterium]